MDLKLASLYRRRRCRLQSITRERLTLWTGRQSSRFILERDKVVDARSVNEQHTSAIHLRTKVDSRCNVRGLLVEQNIDFDNGVSPEQKLTLNGNEMKTWMQLRNYAQMRDFQTTTCPHSSPLVLHWGGTGL